MSKNALGNPEYWTILSLVGSLMIEKIGGSFIPKHQRNYEKGRWLSILIKI